VEWTGDHGKARSISNAAANLVVFAPLFPGVPRRPDVVKPPPEVIEPTAATSAVHIHIIHIFVSESVYMYILQRL